MSPLLPVTAMPSVTLAEADALPRASELFRASENDLRRKVDGIFAWLLLAEWVGAIVVGWILSPRAAFAGWVRTPDLLTAAVALGGFVTLPACALACLRPGKPVTRHAVAIAQMLLGVLLIHLTGGRIETHFFLFVSLAFLSFHRDWRVLATASAVVAVDHLLRGALWPESVYGVGYASVWRTVEHVFWVLFEDAGLVIVCEQGLREMRQTALRHAQLEGKVNAEAQCRSAVEPNRVKGAFLANMSHEIRTPMTAIQGYADLLLDLSLSVSERLSYTMTIRKNSEHLLALMNDVLDLSKIEAGKMTIEKAPCSPAQIVVDVASLMRVRAKEKALAFDVVFSSPIPSTIVSDATRLRQILMNLVGNAIKFTARGSVRLYVRCEAPESKGARLSFEVADTGIGLTRDQMDKIFAPFTQADSSTTRVFGGSGLGLSICKRLAAALEGDLRVESLVGRGSSFTFEMGVGSIAGVPMLRDLREAGVLHRRSHDVTDAACLDGRILLAEDGADNQVLIATHLRRAGAVVSIAENGLLAVDAALEAEREGRAFDVVLMDMQMPQMDGYAATAKLRSMGYTGSIVALTAHAMAGDREACIAAGCDEYLSKPIDRAKLIATVQRFSTRSRVMIESADTIASSFSMPHPEEPPLVSELADDPDLADLVESFASALEERAEVLLAALARDDLQAVRRAVHQLKGAAGGYGYPSITEQARSVEAALASGDADETRRAIEVLCSLCLRATAAVSETRVASAARPAGVRPSPGSRRQSPGATTTLSRDDQLGTLHSTEEAR